MSAATNSSEILGWVNAEEFERMGFRPGGPESDFGARWGEAQTIRASFAPHDGRADGYFYAYDRAADRYALLSATTTRDEVEGAWQVVADVPTITDGHLAMADLVNFDRLRPEHASLLLQHCIERELVVRRNYQASQHDASQRLDAAQAVVVAESARVSAEELLSEALAGRAAEPPAVVRYRVAEWPGWSGRLIAADVPTATKLTAEIRDLAAAHGFSVQATSLSRGHTVLSAARVPELEFASQLEAAAAPAPVSL